MMNLGNAIKIAREARGWSQEELARQCGGELEYIQRVESNNVPPLTSFQIDQWAGFFDIPRTLFLVLAAEEGDRGYSWETVQKWQGITLELLKLEEK